MLNALTLVLFKAKDVFSEGRNQTEQFSPVIMILKTV